MIDVYNDEKGHVWSVWLQIGASDPNQLLSPVCPIDKNVLLVEKNEVWSLTKEHEEPHLMELVCYNIGKIDSHVELWTYF